jgi:hypothetical protein
MSCKFLEVQTLNRVNLEGAVGRKARSQTVRRSISNSDRQVRIEYDSHIAVLKGQTAPEVNLISLFTMQPSDG